MWRALAVVAGFFCAALALVMVVGHLEAKEADPLHSPVLKEQKAKLRANPGDEALKKQIRELDLSLRQSYFQQISRKASGVYLLIGGVVAFVFCAGQARNCRKQLPMPGRKSETDTDRERGKNVARWAVAGVAGIAGVLLAWAAVRNTSPLPKTVPDLAGAPNGEEPAPAAPDAASAEEMKLNWPRFRGWDGGGVSILSNAPVAWDTNSGAGIAWKVPSPAIGFGSPILWGERVFFSGGDAAKRELVCLDLKSGQVAWRQAVANVPGSPAQAPEIPESTGYAAPTVASDGRRVYTIFANGDLAAFTLEGQPVWSKSFGPLKNAYGHATSLCTWRDRLIVQLDQGEAEEAKSKLYALDGRTGQIVWQKPRKAGSSWASPIVFEAAGKPQVIALAVPFAIAYSAVDGAELWRADCLNGEVTPSPVFAGGVLIVPSPSEKLVALRPDGQGDVSKSHVLWTVEENTPDVTSPVSNGELVFAVTTGGMLTCFDGKDGKKVWEHDFEMECHASPTLAAGKLYLFAQKGTAVIVEAGREFKQLFRTEMGDAFHASPAFAQDKIVLRGVKSIWCLGGKS